MSASEFWNQNIRLRNISSAGKEWFYCFGHPAGSGWANSLCTSRWGRAQWRFSGHAGISGDLNRYSRFWQLPWPGSWQQKNSCCKCPAVDALDPPLGDHSFDVIVVCFMHFRAEDEKQFMTANKRLLKPGGLFILEAIRSIKFRFIRGA